MLMLAGNFQFLSHNAKNDLGITTTTTTTTTSIDEDDKEKRTETYARARLVFFYFVRTSHPVSIFVQYVEKAF